MSVEKCSIAVLSTAAVISICVVPPFFALASLAVAWMFFGAVSTVMLASTATYGLSLKKEEQGKSLFTLSMVLLDIIGIFLFVGLDSLLTLGLFVSLSLAIAGLIVLAILLIASGYALNTMLK